MGPFPHFFRETRRYPASILSQKDAKIDGLYYFLLRAQDQISPGPILGRKPVLNPQGHFGARFGFHRAPTFRVFRHMIAAETPLNFDAMSPKIPPNGRAFVCVPKSNFACPICGKLHPIHPRIAHMGSRLSYIILYYQRRPPEIKGPPKLAPRKMGQL